MVLDILKSTKHNLGWYKYLYESNTGLYKE